MVQIYLHSFFTYVSEFFAQNCASDFLDNWLKTQGQKSLKKVRKSRAIYGVHKAKKDIGVNLRVQIKKLYVNKFGASEASFSNEILRWKRNFETIFDKVGWKLTNLVENTWYIYIVRQKNWGKATKLTRNDSKESWEKVLKKKGQ